MGEAPQFWQVIILVSVSDKYSICSVLVISIVSAMVSQSCVEQTKAIGGAAAVSGIILVSFSFFLRYVYVKAFIGRIYIFCQ